MPKGRGANERRRTAKQTHTDRKKKREPQYARGAYMLNDLFNRALMVQTKHRKALRK